MIAAALTLSLWVAGAQGIGSLDAPPAPTRQYVVYAAEPQVVAAGKPDVLQLRFHVGAGLHVNSHTPKGELLIPTRLKLDAKDGVRIGEPAYPAGKEFSFAFDPAEKLDVYADEFSVKLPVVARAGQHELKGSLIYQACNHAACFPPRVLPVDVVFTAK